MNEQGACREIPVSDVGGFAIGHATNRAGGTGCTVIIAPEGARGGVDVRGGAPATRETDLLRPENTVQEVHAVCLSGGSAFGLEAASGVARELERRGIGLDVGPAVVPIVCAASIFDLAFGDAAARPGIADGELAVRDALDARSHTADEGCVGAVAAVNACGNVVDPRTLGPVAGMREDEGSSRIVDMEEALLAQGADAALPLDRTNTTISCVITDAVLTKAECTKVAQIAADAYAHAIRPAHTTNDGDAIFVLASGASGRTFPVDLVGLAACRALEDAIVHGARSAVDMGGLPAAK